MNAKIITIAEETYSRAQLIKGRLEAEGITCFLTHVNLIQSNVGNGVKVKINEDDKVRAEKVLEGILYSFGKEKEIIMNRLKSVRRILIPVDFSAHSINACRYALGIAETLKAEIKILHVYFSPTIDSIHNNEAFSMNFNFDKYIRDIYKSASYDIRMLKVQLLEIIEERNYQHVTITSKLVNGTPERVIMDECKSYDPGIVIMGHKGKGLSKNTLLGSVTSYITEKADRPVLTVPDSSAYLNISSIKNIAYATNFDDSDFRAITELINLTKPFGMNVYCIHVEDRSKNKWDAVKMKGLKEYFAELEVPNLNCITIQADNLVKGVEQFIIDYEIDIFSITTHKRNFFTALLNPSMTKELLRSINKPFLIFHCK